MTVIQRGGGAFAPTWSLTPDLEEGLHHQMYPVYDCHSKRGGAFAPTWSLTPNLEEGLHHEMYPVNDFHSGWGGGGICSNTVSYPKLGGGVTPSNVSCE